MRVTLPPVGYNTIIVRVAAVAPIVYTAQEAQEVAIQSIENEWLRLDYDNATNLLVSITNKVRLG